jgi:glycosyltransferase involved in cell wall biosynthesis
MAERIAVVFPVRNSEGILEESIERLRRFLISNDIPDCEILIADSMSTDATPLIGRKLAKEAGIRYIRIPRRGKGAAIKEAWLSLEDGFEVFCFMDVDLATDLEALPGLIGAVTSGSDVALGSRYLEESVIQRSLLREAISRTYRLIFRMVFRIGISDPQCGFKAVSGSVIEHVLPRVASNGFFFDSELLVRADGYGCSISEIPIRWAESAGSSVRLLRDIPEFLAGLMRLGLRR